MGSSVLTGGGRDVADAPQTDGQECDEQDDVDHQDHRDHAGHGGGLAGADRERHHGRPDEVDGASRLTGDHAVDQQLDGREHRAQQREDPQLVLDGVVLRTTDEGEGQSAERPDDDGPDRAQGQHEGDAPDQRRAASRLGGHRGERHHDDELGKEQQALHEDQSARVEAGGVTVQDEPAQDHVGVGQHEEREQGLRVGCDLTEDGAITVGPGVRGAAVGRRLAQGQPADHGRCREADGQPERSDRLVGPPEQQHRAQEAGDAHAEVEDREREPATLALEDAGLPADHGHRPGDQGEAGGRGHALEVEHRVEDRCQRQADEPQHPRRAVAHAHDCSLDLADVVRRRGDPPGAGRLDAQHQHTDDQAQSGHRGEPAVLARPQQAGGDQRRGVRRDVHDADRDGDGGAAGHQRP